MQFPYSPGKVSGMTMHVRLLGRFEVAVSGEKIPDGAFGDRKSRALLRMLTCHRGSVLTKDFIADALWGEDQPKDSGASIDVLVSRVRKVLGDPALIRSVSGGLVLSDSDWIEVDAESFRESVLQGRHYFAAEHWAQAKSAFDEALGRWGGEPLPEDAYSEWATHLRRELTGLYVEALEGGARASLMLRDWAAAVELSEKAVELEPLREMSNMLLVSAQARAGDQVAALEAFHRYRTRLVDELGLDPSKEAYEIQSQILQGMRQESLELLSHLVPGEARLRSRQALSGKSSAPMRARTLASMAMLAAGSDDYARASELIDMALPDARDDPRALSEVLYVGSIIDMNLGELDRARSRANEALGHFETLGDALGIANILDGRAMATFLDGQIAEGVAAFQRVARLFEESGDIPRIITPLSTRGHGLVFMGRADEGLIETRRALDLAEDLEDLEGRAYALWHCSEALTPLTRWTMRSRAPRSRCGSPKDSSIASGRLRL